MYVSQNIDNSAKTFYKLNFSKYYCMNSIFSEFIIMSDLMLWYHTHSATKL